MDGDSDDSHGIDLHKEGTRLVRLPCGCRVLLMVCRVPASLPDDVLSAVFAETSARQQPQARLQ